MSSLEARPNNGESNESREREFEPRPFENTVVALDVDGVLVDPRAYREATRKTITHFAGWLGVDPKEFMLDDKNSRPGYNMSHWEAVGAHDPWDVSAIIVSLMKLRKAGVVISNGGALEAFQMNASPQSHPPEVILKYLRAKYQRAIPEAMRDIAKNLSKTRDPFNNEVTSVFQEYVLGRKTFESTYGKSSWTGAEESLISTRDQSLINNKGRKDLDEIAQRGGMVVIYTGRPGLPPYDAQREAADGYAPEAELAVARARVEAIGIVSMGSMEWLARVKQTSTESLTKPNPTQALATILSALRGRTNMQILLDAYEWEQTGEAPNELQPFIGDAAKKLELVVVEDSPSGIRAFINAKRILESRGINCGLTAIGVHNRNYDEKHVAFRRLKQEQDVVVDTYTDINPGINRLNFSGRDRVTIETAKV